MTEYTIRSFKDRANAFRKDADILEAAAKGFDETRIAMMVNRPLASVRSVIYRACRIAASDLHNQVFAMNEAGYSCEDIAESLGVEESIIRNHLNDERANRWYSIYRTEADHDKD